MDERAFKQRTKQLGISVVRLLEQLPNNRTTDILGRQLLRSATSVGANYRAACRGRSKADVIAKLGIVEEEADETLYWLEILVETEHLSARHAQPLIDEAEEIIAMVVASIRTMRDRDPFAAVTQSKIQNPKSKMSA